jgi:hypothetical protein
MKLFNYNSTWLILFAIFVLLILIVNLSLNIYPFLDFLKYLENKKYYWTIPVMVLFLSGIWLFDRRMRRKIINERIEIFNATIRTIQDLLQNSSSSMQLLILDMKDEGINEELISRVEKNLAELSSVINALTSIDPTTLELKELNRKLSIIEMNK